MSKFKQHSGHQAVSLLQAYATGMCGTPLRVGGMVQVFNNTLPGPMCRRQTFQMGGASAEYGLLATGKEPPLQCEIWVNPPIGGAGVKVLPSGVRAQSETAAICAAHASIAAPPSEVDRLAMERGIMAQRLPASAAQLGAAKK